jgi:hypothetical protein
VVSAHSSEWFLFTISECFTTRAEVLVDSLVKEVILQLDEASHIKIYIDTLEPGLQLIHCLFAERISLLQSCTDLSLLVPGLFFLAFLEETEVVKELACRLWAQFSGALMVNVKTLVNSMRHWVKGPRSRIR